MTLPHTRPLDLAVHPGASSLVSILQRWSAERPDALALEFILEGSDDAQAFTYGELDRRARAIAAELQARQVSLGSRALLVFPPGLDYVAAFWGCLYAGVLAVPAYPPNPARLGRTLGRLRTIVEDCTPRVVLSSQLITELAAQLGEHAPELAALDWVATDVLPLERAERWRTPELDPGSVAFLQYTSGSTSSPKGVTLTHGNLLHNSQLIYDAFGHGPDSRVMVWLPPYHDMGLIGGILQPLYGGFPVTLMSPFDFLQRPLRWLQAVSRTGATTSGGPNFAFDLCVRKTSPEERAALDLSRWAVAFNGAEPIRAEVLERFAEAFAVAGFRREAFYPCYGLAESTLIVSGGRPGAGAKTLSCDAAALEQHRFSPAGTDGDARALVGCGQALGDEAVAIVDPGTGLPREAGAVGEIWVSSGSVANGYWGRVEATSETFFAEQPGAGKRRFLRTGDLGFLHEGELYVTGRLKDLLIVRGRNHYPQDLELTAERAHPALRPGCGAAFSVDGPSGEQVVLVFEQDRAHAGAPIEEVTAAVAAALAEQHDLSLRALMLVASGAIPKTSSGKIQRRACKQAWLERTFPVVAESAAPAADAIPEDSSEPSRAQLLGAAGQAREVLARRWVIATAARIGHRRASELSGDQPLFSLGFDSLSCVELRNELERGGVALPLRPFLEGATLNELAKLAGEALGAPAQAAPAAARRAGGETPLTRGQQALWFLHQLAPASAAYHVCRAVRVRGSLDADRLAAAVAALAQRHDALRTRFGTRDGVPFQRADGPGLRLQRIDARGLEDARVKGELRALADRPLDLTVGPPGRAALLARSEDEHVLLLVLHHLVCDFWSLAQLLAELEQLYLGQPLPALPEGSSYAALVFAQEQELASGSGSPWEHWARELSGELSALELPTDFPRPPVQRSEGATCTFTVPEPLTRRVHAFARAHGATPFAVLLAAYQAFLARATGQDDVLVGAPAAGRTRAQFGQTVGYFVNPVVLRARFDERPSFAQLVQRTRESVVAALEHQGLPFPTLVERLSPRRDPSRSPVFQTMFTLQRAHAMDERGLSAFAVEGAHAQLKFGPLTLEPLALDRTVAQFDLSLTLASHGADLAGELEFNTGLFTAQTARELVEGFCALLSSLLDAPLQPFDEVAWGGGPLRPERAPAPEPTPLLEAFCASVQRAPDAVALVDGDRRITYAQLAQASDRAAAGLLARGVRAGDPVVLGFPRCADHAVALLGALKAGACAVPLEPSAPPERLRAILANVQPRCVLTRSADLGRWHGAPAATLEELPAGAAPATRPSGAAYCVHTSGSTGEPKGVVVTHAALAGYLSALRDVYGLVPTDRVLALASTAFDVSLEELLGTLAAGATVVLAGPGLSSLGELLALARAHQITVLNMSSPHWHELVNELVERGEAPPASLRLMIVGSDRTSRARYEQWRALAPGVRLLNAYGPTEATVTACVYEPGTHANGGATLPIGRPLPGVEAWVLDGQLRPVPQGIAGELCLSGRQLASGYLNRPELTAERFVPAPGIGVERVYRTGDRVRRLADGSLEFLGRVDGQLKVRGVRVEPGEVEAAIETHPGVAAAAVALRRERLVAFVEPRPGQPLDEVALREHVAARVPEAMVPSLFAPLERLPRLASGKLDRRRLPDVQPSAAALQPPRNEVERVIARVWAEVLGREQVGVRESFFDLGGHSLLLLRVHSRLERELCRSIQVMELFEHPTVESLGRHLSGGDGSAAALAGAQSRAARQREALASAKARRK